MTVDVEQSDGRRRTMSADMEDDDIDIDVEVMLGADGRDDKFTIGDGWALFYIYRGEGFPFQNWWKGRKKRNGRR